MDPVSIIIAAILVGVGSGVTKGSATITEDIVVSSYHKLKNVITERFSSKALALVEKDPNTEIYIQALAKELKDSAADSDTEILALSKTIMNSAENDESERSGLTSLLINDFKAGSLSIDGITAHQGSVELRNFDIKGHANLGNLSTGNVPGKTQG